MKKLFQFPSDATFLKIVLWLVVLGCTGVGLIVIFASVEGAREANRKAATKKDVNPNCRGARNLFSNLRSISYQQ